MLERGVSRTTGVVIPLEGDELVFAQGYLSGFMLNSWRGLWLADRIPGYAITSPAPNVIRFSRDGRVEHITLDPATWLPVRQGATAPADGPRMNGTYYGDWREVEDVRFPTKRSTYRNGIEITEVVDIITRINSGIKPEDLAAKPLDFSPVLPVR